MSRLVRLVFLFTWKGGQWASWQPLTRWREIRAADFDDSSREILIRGGAWDIRLACDADRYPQARAIIEARLPARARVLRRSVGGSS